MEYESSHFLTNTHMQLKSRLLQPFYYRRLGPFCAAEWLSLALFSAGLLAAVIYGVFVSTPGPVYKRSTATGVWFGALLAVFAAQIVLRLRQPPLPFRCGGRSPIGRYRFWLVVYAAASVVCALNFLALAIGRDADGAGWSALTLLALGVLIGAIRARSRDDTAPEGADDDEFAERCPRWRTRWASALLWANAALQWVGLVSLILLTPGSILQADGMVRYSPRGTVARIELADGRRQSLLYNCQGPAPNATYPTVFVDADGAHGAADFWPLQRLLVQAGRRVCIFDKPGLGWSDDYFADQRVSNTLDFYDQLLVATGEPSPYLLVGWGGGGTNVYQYALSYPHKVAGLVLLDVYGDQVEFRGPAAQNGWSQAQADEYRQQSLAGRWALFGLIRGLAVPWGWMSLFIAGDPSAYAWPERFEEYKWFYLTAKTWTTQYFYMREYVSNITASPVPPRYDLGLFNVTNDALMGKPLLAVITERSDAAVCSGIDPHSSQCQTNLFNEHFLAQDARAVANVTGNAKFYICNASDCDLGFPLRKPEVVVDAMRLYFGPP